MTIAIVSDGKALLPQGWRRVQLGSICDIVIGRTPRRDNPAYWGGRLPWVSISDLNNDVVEHTKEGITELGATESRSRLLPRGTLLFSFKLTIGKMAIAGIDVFTNEAIAGLIPRAGLDRDYLRFALSGIDAAAGSSHAVKGKTLNQDTIRALEIPLPPLPEQQRIAALLTRQMAAVERARRAAEAQVQAARQLSASYLMAAFDGPESQLWPKRRLGTVLRLRKDVVHPHDNPIGPATFVGLEHIESHTGRRIGSDDVELATLMGRKPRFFAGDIVYGYLRPYLNKVWVADFDGLCSVDQYVYSVDSAVADVNFIALFMRSPVYLRRAPIDTTPGQLPRIRTEEVGGVEIGLPSLDEQRAIGLTLAERMEKVEQTRSTLEARLSVIGRLPAALLRQAFSGAQ